AMNYSSKWIEEVGDDADSDNWIDAATTVVFSFAYMFQNGLELFFQANNLTDEVKYVYYGVPTRSTEYTLTGRSFNLGMRFVLYKRKDVPFTSPSAAGASGACRGTPRCRCTG